MECSEDLGQHAQRIQSRAAIEARMQVARGTAEGDFGKGETAQKGGNSRRIGIPLARVANKRDVGPELIAMSREEREEARAA